MASKSQVELEIVARLASAEKDIKRLAQTSSKQAKSIEDGFKKSFSVVRTTAVAAFAYLGSKAVIGAVQSVTRAASIQEDAINNLNTAMRVAGDFSEAASKDFQKFASEIQSTTKFGDEAILKQAALAKAFGATNDQAKLITQAAVELSAATGKSLDEATRQVSKTLGGFAGELGEVNPAIKALTAEQLKAGEAARILIEQYGGSAAGQINTFSGALTQTENLFGDLLEEIGFLITQNPIVIDGIKLVGSAFSSLGNFIKDNRETIIDLSNRVLVGLIDAFVYVGEAIRPIVSVMLGLAALAIKFQAKIQLARIAVMEFALSFESVQKVVNFVADAFRVMAVGITDAIANIVKLLSHLPGVGTDLDGIIESIEGVRNGFAASFGTDVTEPIRKNLQLQKEVAKTIDKEVVGAVDKLREGYDATLASAKKAGEEIENVANKASGSAVNITGGGGSGEAGSDYVESEGERVDKSKENEGAKLAASIVSGFQQGSTLFLDFMQGGFIDRTIGAFQGITDLPTKFKEFTEKLGELLPRIFDKLPASLEKMITTVIPKIADQMVSVFNKLVELVVQKGPDLFAALIDAALKFVEAIVKALPKLIAVIPKLVEKLAQAIPKLITIILKGLPKIIMALAKAIPQIVRTLAAAIPEIVIAIAENIAPVVLALVQGIIEAIPAIIFALVDEFILKGGIFRIIGALIKAIPQIAIALVQGIVRGLSNGLGSAFKGFGKIFSGAIKLPKFSIGKLKDILSGKDAVDKLRALFEKFNIVERLKEAFNKITEQIKKALSFGIGGGGKGKKGSITGIKGSPLATGGLVPAGFPNDTFPARLTSGETVITPGDTKRLGRFLDRVEAGGGSAAIDYNRLAQAVGSQPITVVLKLNEQDLARANFNLRRNGFRN